MNLKQLITRSHKQSVEKGFWENPMSFDMAMTLIISEISEAVEAHRKGRLEPDWNDTQSVKESFGAEIADAIIRIFDWCGRHDYELEFIPKTGFQYWNKVDEGSNFMHLFYTFSHYWSVGEDKESTFESLFNWLMDYSKFHKIDIEKYILWKLDYNMSRPYKHGKNY